MASSFNALPPAWAAAQGWIPLSRQQAFISKGGNMPSFIKMPRASKEDIRRQDEYSSERWRGSFNNRDRANIERGQQSQQFLRDIATNRKKRKEQPFENTRLGVEKNKPQKTGKVYSRIQNRLNSKSTILSGGFVY